jgi:large subunit ribosomal protein L22
MKTQTAKLRYLKISPRKTRLVTDLIKGLSTNEAEAQLLMLPNRASGPILKLLRSAIANAKNNQKLNPDRLWIKDIRVDIGPRQKRWRMRARGAVSLIEKKSSHITMVLAEAEKETPPKFKFMPKPKKVKKGKSKKEKTTKEKFEKSEKEEKTKETKPKRFEALKRIFRRKVI